MTGRVTFSLPWISTVTASVRPSAKPSGASWNRPRKKATGVSTIWPGKWYSVANFTGTDRPGARGTRFEGRDGAATRAAGSWARKTAARPPSGYPAGARTVTVLTAPGAGPG